MPGCGCDGFRYIGGGNCGRVVYRLQYACGHQSCKLIVGKGEYVSGAVDIAQYHVAGAGIGLCGQTDLKVCLSGIIFLKRGDHCL